MRGILRLMRLAGVLFVCFAGCDLDTLDETFTGPASQPDYVVGATYAASGGVVYVCGTSDATRDNSEWFVVGARGTLTAPSGGDIRGNIQRTGRLEGEVTLGSGERVSFDLGPSVDGALLDAVDAGCRTGVVTYEVDGEQRAAGTWSSKEGIYEQVTPITPIEVARQGLWVAIGKDATRRLLVSPVGAELR